MNTDARWLSSVSIDDIGRYRFRMSTDSIDGSALEQLSPAARHALRIDDGRAYAELVPTHAGAAEARDALETLKPAGLTAAPAVDRLAAAAAVSGLWLWHDFLEESHTICQGIDTPEGSLWHAILHRREGDFSNAKYWFRQAGVMPIDASVAAKVDALTNALPVDKLIFRLTANGWNPSAFVDLVERVHGTPGDERRGLCVTIQRIEWRAAFEHCVRLAAGR